ncbi:hypothetical protein Agub_g12179, partial [Astrephomene gubernaculifera]
MSQLRVEQPRPQGVYPRCSSCGEEAIARMAKTDSNYGRWFFKCPQDHPNPWFWADQYLPPAGGAAAAGARAAGPHGAHGAGSGAAHPPSTPQQQHPGPRAFGSPAGAVPFPGFGNAPQSPQPALVNPYAAHPNPPPAPGVGQGIVVHVQVLDSCRRELGLSLPVFHEPFRGVFMQLDSRSTGRRWDPHLKCWRVRADSYPQFQQHLRQHGYQLKDAPPEVISILVHHNSRFNPKMSMQEAGQFAVSRVSPSLWSRLFRYQREGVVAGVRLGGRMLLADEMGLGKTVQALALLSCYPEDWPLLVVCPTSLRYTWQAAIQEWLPPSLRPAERDLWLITASADWKKLAERAEDGGG